jgi:hypothetical protein
MAHLVSHQERALNPSILGIPLGYLHEPRSLDRCWLPVAREWRRLRCQRVSSLSCFHYIILMTATDSYKGSSPACEGKPQAKRHVAGGGRASTQTRPPRLARKKPPAYCILTMRNGRLAGVLQECLRQPGRVYLT